MSIRGTRVWVWGTGIAVVCLRFSLVAGQQGPTPAAQGERQLPQPFASWQEALSQGRFIAASVPKYDPNPASYAEPSGDELAAALARIRTLCDGLVLYATSPFEMRLLEEAHNQGFRAFVLGIWDPRSDDELARAAEACRRWPQLCVAIVVGNEGLQFNRYRPQDLEKAAEYLHQRCPGVALTTSEPISSYGDPFLREFGGGLLAPNVHPWFVDQREPEQAVAWVIERVKALREWAGDGDFIFVKETGLPSGPEPDASPERQADFWVRLTKALPLAPNTGVAYFEAHDLPWKARETWLPVEEHWGFWEANGTPKPVVAALAKG